MAVKPFVSSAFFTDFSLPPVICPHDLNQRCVLYLCNQSLSLFSLVDTIGIKSIACRCLLSSSANPQRCSIGSKRKVSNFRFVWIYECDGSVCTSPMFYFLCQTNRPLYFRTFNSLFSVGNMELFMGLLKNSEVRPERELGGGHRRSYVGSSPCCARATSSWTPIFGCQVVYICNIFCSILWGWGGLYMLSGLQGLWLFSKRKFVLVYAH